MRQLSKPHKILQLWGVIGVLLLTLLLFSLNVLAPLVTIRVGGTEMSATGTSVSAFADAWDVDVDIRGGDDLQIVASWSAMDTSSPGPGETGSGHEFAMEVTSIP